jgi:hypothetical protein
MPFFAACFIKNAYLNSTFFLKKVLENLLGDPIFSNVTGSSSLKRTSVTPFDD